MLGDIELEPATEANIGNVIDMLNLQNGGRCLSYSNAHFGHPQNLMKPGRATSMNSGWETGLYLFVILNLVFYKKKIKQFKQCESSLLTVVSSSFQIRYILKTNLCLCILLWSLLFFVQFSDNFIMCTIHRQSIPLSLQYCPIDSVLNELWIRDFIDVNFPTISRVLSNRVFTNALNGNSSNFSPSGNCHRSRILRRLDSTMPRQTYPPEH